MRMKFHLFAILVILLMQGSVSPRVRADPGDQPPEPPSGAGGPQASFVAPRSVAALPSSALELRSVPLPAELTLLQDPTLVTLTRPEAITEAMERNPSQAASRQRLRAAAGEYRSRSAASSPQLSLGGTWVPRPSDAEDAAKSMFPDTDETHLSHTFPTSGRRRHQTRAARERYQSARAELTTSELDLQTSVIQAYIDLQVARRAVEAHEDGYRIAATLTHVTRVQYQAQAVPESNVLRAQVEESRATQDLLRSHADLVTKQAALAFQLGRPIGLPLEAAEALDGRPIALSREEAVVLAFANRPEVRRARALARSLEAEVEVARSGRRPDLTLRVHATDTLTNGGNTPIIASANFPLWDRGLIGGEVQRLQAEARAASYLVEGTRRQIELEVVRSYQQVLSGQKGLEILTTGIAPRAQVLLERAKVAYLLGEGTLLDLLDAQRVYRQTALDRVLAMGDLERSISVLERAVGAPVARGGP